MPPWDHVPDLLPRERRWDVLIRHLQLRDPLFQVIQLQTWQKQGKNMKTLLKYAVKHCNATTLANNTDSLCHT